MNVITLSATDFPIKSVKIFSSDLLAEVTRVFPLDFTQSLAQDGSQVGSQVIEISNLPNLHISGIRACVTTGSDDLLVMDYYCHSRPNVDPVSSDVLRDLKAECTRLEDERRLRQQSFAFLSTYMNSLAKGDAPSVAEPAQLVTFFDEFVEIGKSRSEVIAVLDQQIKDVTKELDKEIHRLYLESLSLVTKATVVIAPVSGRTATIAELELKYRVSATWKPEYEMHVTTIDGVPSPSVSLTYRCLIFQSTGENWDNVELAVTTAKSRAPSGGLPEPKRTEIRQQGPLVQPDSYHESAVKPQITPLWKTPGHGSLFGSAMPSTQQASQGLFGSAFGASHQADSSQASFGAAQGPAAGNVFGASQAQPTATTPGLFGSTSAQPIASSTLAFGASQFPAQPTATTSGLFGSTSTQPIAGSTLAFGASQFPAQPTATTSGLFGSKPPPYSSPQNSNVSNVTHTATAKVSIPSRAAGGCHHVLIATIPLKAIFTRIAVPSIDTRVFFTCDILNSSNYVLTPGTVHTRLDGKHVSDSDITSVKQPQTIHCSLGIDPAVTTQFSRSVDSLPDFTVLNGKVVTTHTITTTIKNTHRHPVSNVIVRTSLPLPADPRVTVALQEPEGLAGIDSGTVRVRDGCHARWLTTGNRAGKNDGLFEWVCSSVKPGSEMLKAVWYVTAPRGLSFTTQ
ncbi:hypothetical protein DEU56DRAFT_896191 [Suillus clintonianus]|uniref:uncharacterized protein n=1 Tax=Suillus clintonianus TaxID=1904413 RepID=UPI001B87F80F|nr:uncharacterized protein DEU56DRAFT_896191 [Suillus clintonianus]KAG2114827.1 hypothetical protein DEU56DRAFT_896191 [Suillus clintonianus]